MRILSVEAYGSFVGSRKGRVVVRRSREKVVEVPALNIELVLLSSRGVSVSLDFLDLMLRYNIPVIVTRRGRPVGMLVSFAQRGHVEAVRRQFEAQGDERGVSVAVELVYSKVYNQASMLKRVLRDRRVPSDVAASVMGAVSELEDVAGQVLEVGGGSCGSVRKRLMSLEAMAAKSYWDAFGRLVDGGWGFPGRVKRGACDAVNMALNYAYSLLSSVVWISVLRSGLDPWVGFLHSSNQRRPALVFDLMEPFRPVVVDRMVLSLFASPPDREPVFEDCMLPPEHRALILENFSRRLGVLVRVGSRRIELRDAILYVARGLMRFLMGYSGRFEGFRWR